MGRHINRWREAPMIFHFVPCCSSCFGTNLYLMRAPVASDGSTTHMHVCLDCGAITKNIIEFPSDGNRPEVTRYHSHDDE